MNIQSSKMQSIVCYPVFCLPQVLAPETMCKFQCIPIGNEGTVIVLGLKAQNAKMLSYFQVKKATFFNDVVFAQMISGLAGQEGGTFIQILGNRYHFYQNSIIIQTARAPSFYFSPLFLSLWVVLQLHSKYPLCSNLSKNEERNEEPTWKIEMHHRLLINFVACHFWCELFAKSRSRERRSNRTGHGLILARFGICHTKKTGSF